MVQAKTISLRDDEFTLGKKAELAEISAEMDELAEAAAQVRSDAKVKRQEALETLALGFGFGLVVVSLIGLAGLAELLDLNRSAQAQSVASGWVMFAAMTGLVLTLMFTLGKGSRTWDAYKQLVRTADHLDGQEERQEKLVRREMLDHLDELEKAAKQAEELEKGTHKETFQEAVADLAGLKKAQTASGSVSQSDQNAKRNPKGGSGR